MRWFIIWNDTWQWSHSSHLLKINFAKVKPFIKSCHDVMQIAHMAPRRLHTTLHRCYHITWQHYRRMWSQAKINVCRKSWFDLFRGDIFPKPTAHTVSSLPAHCASVSLLQIHMIQVVDGSHRKVTKHKLLRTEVIFCLGNSGLCLPCFCNWFLVINMFLNVDFLSSNVFIQKTAWSY